MTHTLDEGRTEILAARAEDLWRAREEAERMMEKAEERHMEIAKAVDLLGELWISHEDVDNGSESY